jgi:hypothetical protein
MRAQMQGTLDRGTSGTSVYGFAQSQNSCYKRSYPLNQANMTLRLSLNNVLKHLPGGRSLTGAKDKLLSKRAIEKINHLIRRYGTMLDLKLNTVDKSVSLSVLLKGEQAPLEIHVKQYALTHKKGQLYLEIDGTTAETSREWLTRLIQDKIGHRKFRVPEEVAWVLEMLS